MLIARFITPTILIIFGLYILVASWELQAESGNIPFYLSLLLIICSVATLFISTDEVGSKTGSPIKLLGYILLIAIFLYSITELGFFVSSAIFLVIFSILLGYKRYTLLGISVVFFLIFCQYVFVEALHIPLPKF